MRSRVQAPQTSNSFRREFTDRSSGYRTPSPPRGAVEPISPVGGPEHDGILYAPPTTKKRKASYPVYTNGAKLKSWDRDHCEWVNELGGRFAPSRPSPIDSALRYQSQGLQSPLDVFATVATNPLLGEPLHAGYQYRSSADYSFHGYEPYQNPDQNNHIAKVKNGREERQTKRSRSEVEGPRPHIHTTLRPATSHVAQSLWPWQSTTQQSSAPVACHDNMQDTPLRNGATQSSATSDNVVQEAELLLSFARGSSYQTSHHHDLYSSSQVLPSSTISPEWLWSPNIEHTQANDSSRILRLPNIIHNQMPSSQIQIKQCQETPQAQHEGKTNLYLETLKAQNIPAHFGVAKSNGDVECEDRSPVAPEHDDEQHIPNTCLPATNYGSAEKGKVIGHKSCPDGKSKGSRLNERLKEGTTEGVTKVQNTWTSSMYPGYGNSSMPMAESALESKGEDIKVPSGALLVPQVPLQNESTPDMTINGRRHSATGVYNSKIRGSPQATTQRRQVSVPLEVATEIGKSGNLDQSSHNVSVPVERGMMKQQSTMCASCQSTQDPSNGYHDLWISCHDCNNWFHYICAGFKNEREVKDVDKFYCKGCEPKRGATTFVRKSARAHTAVDYAGLHEGKVLTSEDIPEHHYIKPIKEGKLQLQPESFARMRPELVTIEYFERCGGMTEPILIPASLNPRPPIPGVEEQQTLDQLSLSDPQSNVQEATQWFSEDYDYDCVRDDGQDKLDMVIPQGLTVRKVAELYGPEEKVEVIDVKRQEGAAKGWNMRQWADYYEAEGEKPVRNVISLEVSMSKLGRLIRRPKVVRDLDLQDSVWPQEDVAKGFYPKVQFYCLMSVADCYTDFHIDFGGSSVYYHILKGKKTFFFIPPKKQHLKKYEEWCLSRDQNSIFLGDETKECYRVDLTEGDTMLIPSGWIHAVWTPENSLVIGGNFLTRLHYGMQIQINDIEKNTNVARKYRYPYFQRVMWFAVLQYVQQDPVPSTVARILFDGQKFCRDVPVYYEFGSNDRHSDNADYQNARFYSQGEIDGLQDLVRYIFRTVLISLGKMQGVTKGTQDAVLKSMPKGVGEHLEVAKTFALWAAWKRGNEELPQWAHPDALLSKVETIAGGRRKGAVPLKRKERQAALNAFITTSERRSSRHAPKGSETGLVKPAPVEQTDATATSITLIPTPSNNSILAPCRDSCEACRKQSIRCEHHEENGAIRPDPMQRFGIRIVAPRASSIVETPNNIELPNVGSERVLVSPLSSKFTSVPGPLVLLKSESSTEMNARAPRSVDIAQTPNQVEAQAATPNVSLNIPVPHPHPTTTSNARQLRAKACLECRKSKRRCVHNEKGEIDPVKAQEAPVSRGPRSAKRANGDGEVAKSDVKRHKWEPDEIEGRYTGSPETRDQSRHHFSVLATAEVRVHGSGISCGTLSSSQLYDPSHAPLSYIPTVSDRETSVFQGSAVEQMKSCSTRLYGRLPDPAFPFSEKSSLPESMSMEQTSDSYNPGKTPGSTVISKMYDDATGVMPGSPPSPQPLILVADSMARRDFPQSHNETSSESRSRSPSLHVHTNSTKSVNTSTSLPPSPLTELEPSSPNPESTENDGVVIGAEKSQTFRSKARPRERSPNTTFVNRVARHDRPPSSSVPSYSSGPDKPQPTIEGTGHKEQCIGSEDFGHEIYRSTPSIQARSNMLTMAVTDDEEDESLRLVRQLTELDFGLRKRSK